MIHTLGTNKEWATIQAGRAWKRTPVQAAPEGSPADPPVLVRVCVVCRQTRQRRTPVRAVPLNRFVAAPGAKHMKRL
jgi:hypothetical protein